MALYFDDTYRTCSEYSIAMIVANAVRGDSRVLKTAYSLSKCGFMVHLFGIDKVPQPEVVDGYPFRITLVPNPIPKMKKEGVWWGTHEQQNIELFVDRLAVAFLDAIEGKCYDFLHTHDMYGLPTGAKLRERFAIGEKGWIHDLHEYVEGCTHIDEYKRLFCLSQEEKYIHEPDALTTVSPILSRLIAERYELPPPGIVLNTPRLSDFDLFYSNPIRRALAIEDGIPLLVYSGNVKPERGVHYAVEALPLLPGVHLALLTNSVGPYLNQLRSTASRIGVGKRLHVHPYVPYYDVTSFLRGTTCGVYPITQYGNADLALPTKLFEYIHAGAPVVSTDNTAMSGFLAENNCGFTYPIGDIEGFAGAVKKSLSHYPEGLPNVAQDSELLKHYCWEEQEKNIFTFYQERVTKHRPTSGKCPALDVQPILHLPTHAANQPGTLARATANQGFMAKCAALGTNLFHYADDISIVNQKHTLLSVSSYFFKQKLCEYKTYHFHARPLLYNKFFGFPTGFDFVLLKAMGKRVFFHFRGSEIRLPSVFKEATPYNYINEQICCKDKTMPYFFNESDQIAFRDFAFGVCDAVFVNDPELQCYAPNSLIVPRAIDFTTLDACEPESRRLIPLIVHAPSRPGVKGTQSVLTAIENLRRKGYIFDFKLVEKMSHKDAMAVYRDATIIVDQLRIGWYGVLAVEGMAMGKAVVSYVRNDLRHYLPTPSPLAFSNPDNITEVLRYLLDNSDAVTRYGESGRKFAEEYHNAVIIAKQLMHIYRRPVRPIDPIAVVDFIIHQNGNEKGPIKSQKQDATSALKFTKTCNANNNLKKFINATRREGLVSAVMKTTRVIKNYFH